MNRKIPILIAASMAISILPALAADKSDTNSESISSESKATASKMGQSLNDAGTTASIKSKLLTNKSTSAMAISVTTTQGVVTLSGKVKSDAEKDLAEQIARGTSGVTDVHIELTVGKS